MKILFSHSDGETQNFGQALARGLGEQEVIALFGKLGAGKTQFAKGLARGLGVRTPITSPTFTFLKSYGFKKNGKKFLLNHFDFYRIRSAAELAGVNLFETLAEKDSITVIEWPEKVTSILPKNCLKIYFSYGKKENERKIRAVGNFPAAGSPPTK